MNFIKNIIEINGRNIFYWEKNRDKKEIIILLHGFPGSHGGLVDMANGLGDYRLIIPDLPACGLSESLSGKPNLENYSKWLDDFLKKLSIDCPVILGHSFGSRIAIVFGSRYPEKVKKLVLITPVVKVDGLLARFVSVEYEIAKVLPQNLKKIWLSNKIHRKVGDMIIFKSASSKRKKQLIAREDKDLKCLDPQINIELFDEFYRFSLVPISKKIKIKSLIIAGELDEVAPLESVRELAEQLVDSKFVIMEHSGHVVVAERPLTTARIVREWLV